MQLPAADVLSPPLPLLNDELSPFSFSIVIKTVVQYD